MKVFERRFLIENSFFIFCLLSPFLSHAEPTLTREKGEALDGSRDEFFVRDANCDSVKEHIQILAKWTKSIHRDSSCNVNAIKPKQKGEACVANVSKCLPKHVLNYQGKTPAYNGPNCWNLSLVMKEILPGLRYSTPDEMAYYMRPPICRNLAPDEKKQVGDVGAIRGVFEGLKEESHGFIYLSDDLSYSKNGFSKVAPYEVQSTEKVLSIYGVPKDPKCRENQLDTHSDCGTAVSYFRCSSFEDFLKKSPELKAPTLSSVRHVIHFEQCLEHATINGVALRPDALHTIETSIGALVKYLNEQKNRAHDEKESFVLGSLYLRLNAIGEQLDLMTSSDDSIVYMGPSSQSRKAFELAEMIKTSHGELDKLVEGINQ